MFFTHDHKICLSASDLSKHLGCRFLTQLDWAHLEKRIGKKHYEDLSLEAFQKRGLEHENAYLEFLKEKGLSVFEIGDNRSYEYAVSAMQEGHDIISQATLSSDGWMGRADILKKVNRPSRFGNWSYEVVDTKFSAETKAGTILQLCLYSDLLATMQDTIPNLMSVVPPGFLPIEYNFSKYNAYFRVIKNSLQKTILEPPINLEHPQGIYPEPVVQCDFCDWNTACKKRRRDDDDLSIVAGINKRQKKVLHTQEIKTMTSLAEWNIHLDWRPSKGTKESYIKTQEQAKIQYKSKQENKILYELLPLDEDTGLRGLPIPSQGDIFFDIEGDAFVGKQGLEYLLGFSYFDDEGNLQYSRYWSKSLDEEKVSFEKLMHFIMDRLKKYPDLHIYHYAPYETGAVKRLMSKHAVYEHEVDTLLMMQLFVDLMRVVKRSMIVGVERYSIKELEPLYQFHRDCPLRDASMALHYLEFMYEIDQVGSLDQKMADVVEAYNRDDCISTKELRDWLENVRGDLIKKGNQIDRPIAPADINSERELTEKEKAIQFLQEKLNKNLPTKREEQNFQEHMRWILSQLLGFHDRESKATFWEYYRLVSLVDKELFDEDSAIYSLQYIEDVGGTEKNPVCRYSFPSQPVDIAIDDSAKEAGSGDKYGTFISFDRSKCLVDIKKNRDTPHAVSVFSFKSFSTNEQHKAIMRLGEWVAEYSLDSLGEFQATRDLLLKQSPRLHSGVFSDKLKTDEKSNIEAAIQIARELNSGVLAIQGPPGSGKTYLAAEVITALVHDGKTIGITAQSHKVIQNLLERITENCAEKGLMIRCARKVTQKSKNNKGRIEEINDNKQLKKRIEEKTIDVVGGTSWVWSREDFFESIDYLFIDEAGQFSLADALAVSQSAKNLILLGDPQQLERPIQATHPENTDISALQHLMDEGMATISEEKGLFLKDTWRMHPDISSFISEQFYDGKLSSREECSFQKIIGSSFAGTGLRTVLAQHEGNQNSSEEEIKIISEIHHELLSKASWLDRDKIEKKITEDDILIITPYNAQVRGLQVALPQARVGTVDKFQGQEAAIVIYSLATSNAEEAPRGMSFLYSQNRLNVAVSRAKCVSIMVGNPELFRPSCRDPVQMKLANSFCRYQEYAEKK